MMLPLSGTMLPLAATPRGLPSATSPSMRKLSLSAPPSSSRPTPNERRGAAPAMDTDLDGLDGRSSPPGRTSRQRGGSPPQLLADVPEWGAGTSLLGVLAPHPQDRPRDRPVSPVGQAPGGLGATGV